MMSLPRQVGAPLHLEVANILRAYPEVLAEMEKDQERKKQVEELKAQVKKNEDNNTFFAGLDFSAYITGVTLTRLLEARQEKILREFEVDAHQLRERLREQKGYADQATPHSSPVAMVGVRNSMSIASSAEEILRNAINAFRALQDRVNNWEEQEWRPTVEKAAKETADALAKQFSEELNADTDYQTLYKALLNNVSDNPDQKIQNKFEKFEELNDEFGTTIEQQLKARSSPDRQRGLMVNHELLGGVVVAGRLFEVNSSFIDLLRSCGIDKANPEVFERYTKTNPVKRAIRSVNTGQMGTLIKDYYRDPLMETCVKHAKEHAELHALRTRANKGKIQLIEALQDVEKLDLRKTPRPMPSMSRAQSKEEEERQRAQAKRGKK